jgi:hypothetical protein
MNNVRYTKIGRYIINWDERYYIAYAGGTRELPEKEAKEYKKILSLPFIAQRKELKELGFDKNPNVVPISGLKLVEMIKDKSLLPMFDYYFDQSHLVQINDAIVFESIRQKNYDILKTGEVY